MSTHDICFHGEIRKKKLLLPPSYLELYINELEPSKAYKMSPANHLTCAFICTNLCIHMHSLNFAVSTNYMYVNLLKLSLPLSLSELIQQTTN